MTGQSILTLAVLRHRDGWRVIGPTGALRRFAYRVDAEEAALRLAAQKASADVDVVILVQNRFGELRPLLDG